MTDARETAQRVLSLLDLTSLKQSDDKNAIHSLCSQAKTSSGQVAAVCVLPQFVGTAKKALHSAGCIDVKVATVSNFPAGAVSLLQATETTAKAVSDGADEVDLVFPWRAMMAGDAMVGEELVRASRRACGNTARLKVIIESGMLAAPAFIRQASEICIDAGADFIKTSTGTAPVSATPDAVRLIAQVIKDSGCNCGIKVSGGVNSMGEAVQYLGIVEGLMGCDWANSDNFRFGASRLLHDLLLIIDGGPNEGQKSV